MFLEMIKTTFRRPDVSAEIINVRKLATFRRITLSTGVMHLNLHIGVVFLFLLSAERVVYGVWESSYIGSPPSADPLSLVAGFVSICLWFVITPGWVTTHRMNFVHAVVMARMCWQVSATSSAFRLVFRSVNSTALRLGCGIAFGNARFTLALNLVYLVISSYTYVHVSKLDPAVLEHFGPDNALWFIMDNTFCALVVCAASFAVESRLIAEAHATVKARMFREVETTAKNLLAALCDAVVHLSSNLSMSDSSPQLKALLLHARHLKGHSFVDLLEESDRPRFEESMETVSRRACARAAADEVIPAVLLHVHMRDTLGTRISVQLFAAALLEVDGSSGFLVGIRELSRDADDNFPVAPHMNAPSPSIVGLIQTNTMLSLADHPRSNRNNSEVESRSSISSAGLSSKSGSSGGTMPCTEFNGAEVAILFNAWDFIILEGTPACGFLGGPSYVGNNFCDWFADRKEFKKTFEKHINELLQGEGGPKLSLGRVRLKPPPVKRSKIEYVAECSLEFFSVNLEDEMFSSAPFPVLASFTNISQRASRKTRIKKTSTAVTVHYSL